MKCQVQFNGFLCCFRVTHESISLLQTLAQLTFQTETKRGEEWLWMGVVLLCVFQSLWCYHSAVLSEQGAAGEALQPHELTRLPGDGGRGVQGSASSTASSSCLAS